MFALVTLTFTQRVEGEEIVYSSTIREETEEWFADTKQTSGYIFRNRFGERITARGIAHQLKKYAERYGLNTNVVYPHSFRHRYAKKFS